MSLPILEKLEIRQEENEIIRKYRNEEEQKLQLNHSDALGNELFSQYKDWLNGKYDVGTAGQMSWAQRFYSIYSELFYNQIDVFELLNRYRKDHPSDWDYPDSKILADSLENIAEGQLKERIIEKMKEPFLEQELVLVQHAHGYISKADYQPSKTVPYLPEIQRIQFSSKPMLMTKDEAAYLEKLLGQGQLIQHSVQLENKKLVTKFLAKAADVVEQNQLDQANGTNHAGEYLEKLKKEYFLSGKWIEMNADSQKVIMEMNRQESDQTVIKGLEELFNGGNWTGLSEEVILANSEKLPAEYLDFSSRKIRHAENWVKQFDDLLPKAVVKKIQTSLDRLKLNDQENRTLELNEENLLNILPPSAKDYLLNKEQTFILTDEDVKWAVEKEKLISKGKSQLDPLEPSSDDVNQKWTEKQDLKESHMKTSSEEQQDLHFSELSAEDLSSAALRQIREYVTNPEDFREYLDFMSHFYQYSPRNAALIKEQWKGAQAVATFDQWKKIGKELGLSPEDVEVTQRVFINKKTGKETEVTLDQLSVKAGEKAQITLFRPMLQTIIPVLDANGKPMKDANGKIKCKDYRKATLKEKQWVKSGRIKTQQIQLRDQYGRAKYLTFKVFELSQTNLKPESYPKALPNRPLISPKGSEKICSELLDGLKEVGNDFSIAFYPDVPLEVWSSVQIDKGGLGNVKGFFQSDTNEIWINPRSNDYEKVYTSLHEFGHALLHNQEQRAKNGEIPNHQKELEAELTSYVVGKQFGIDNSEESIPYIATWTDRLKLLDDKELFQSLGRVHQASSKLIKQLNQKLSNQPQKPLILNQNQVVKPI